MPKALDSKADLGFSALTRRRGETCEDVHESVQQEAQHHPSDAGQDPGADEEEHHEVGERVQRWKQQLEK